MSIVGKQLCDCGRVATWWYMPGFRDFRNPHFCDSCVSRGCSCNEYYTELNEEDLPFTIEPTEKDGDEGFDWIWLNKEKTKWARIDEEGRRYPCCEYMYSEDGWDL